MITMVRPLSAKRDRECMPGHVLLFAYERFAASLFLNFFSWGASVAGPAFGTIGFAMYSRGKESNQSSCSASATAASIVIA